MDPVYYEKRLLHDLAREASAASDVELTDSELSAKVSEAVVKLRDDLLKLFEDNLESHIPVSDHPLEEFSKKIIHRSKSSTKECCEKIQQFSAMTNELRTRSADVKITIERISDWNLPEVVNGRIEYDEIQQRAIKENLVLHTLQLMKETYVDNPRIIPALSKIKESLLADRQQQVLRKLELEEKKREYESLSPELLKELQALRKRKEYLEGALQSLT